MNNVTQRTDAFNWRSGTAITIGAPNRKPKTMTAQERTASILRVNPNSCTAVNHKDQYHVTQRISQASI